MVIICDNCKLRDLGCVVKQQVLASPNFSCSLHAQVMEKTADETVYTCSWPSGDGINTIVQTNQGGRIISSETRPNLQKIS